MRSDFVPKCIATVGPGPLPSSAESEIEKEFEEPKYASRDYSCWDALDSEDKLEHCDFINGYMYKDFCVEFS